MMNSRSKASKSKQLALLVLALVLGLVGTVHAEPKRVVVLDLEGPSRDKIHLDLVKLIKRTHLIISTATWNTTVEQLGADISSPADLKRVAAKLRVDVIVEGKIELRNDRFLIKLQLFHGETGAKTGELIGTSSEEPGLDTQAQRDLKQELISAISSIDNPRAERPADGDPEPASKPDDKPGKPSKPAGKASKPDDDPPVDDTPDPAEPSAKPRTQPGKQVAVADKPRTGETIEQAPDAPLERAAITSPGERAIDIAAGMSLSSRQLAFESRPGFTIFVPGYDGKPVGGAMVDVTVYPLAIGHTRSGAAKNLGLTAMYDRVVSISSSDVGQGKYDTTQSRFAIGAVGRYPLRRTPDAPVLGASLVYSNQVFEIAQSPDVPSVDYAMFVPGVFARLPVFGAVVLGIDAKVLLITDTGQLQDQMHYGTTDLIGFEGAFSLDWMLTRHVFVRTAFRYETIRFDFRGNGALTAGRDNDLSTADVKTGHDTYVGGFVTAGLAY